MTAPSAFRRVACVVLGLSAHLLAAGEPVQAAGQVLAAPKVINYRNDWSGVYPDAQPPVDLDWSAPGSVLWKTPIPGSACASDPIIVGERVFVQSEPLRLMCLDKHTGKVLWERGQHARPDVPTEDKAFRLERYHLWWTREIDPDNNKGFGPKKLLGNGKLPADVRARLEKAMQDAPETWPGCNIDDIFGHPCCVSPASDGQRLVAAFRNGEVVCYDLEGNRQWLYLILNKDGTVPAGDVKGHTPLMMDGIVAIYWTIPPRFLCLDAVTGKEQWTSVLGNEKRLGGRSPAATCRGGMWYACSPGGSLVRVADGKILLTAASTAMFNPTSVSHTDGLFDLGNCGIVVPDRPDSEAVVAWCRKTEWLQQVVKDGQAPLNWEECSAIFQKQNNRGRFEGFGYGNDRYFAASVTKDGIIYTYSSSMSAFAARDLKTDKFLYVRNLTDKPNPLGIAYADLCLAGDYIFVNNGAAVLKAGREFALVKRMRAGGHYACNLVFDGGRVYWRDAKNLVCVGGTSLSETSVKEKTP